MGTHSDNNAHLNKGMIVTFSKPIVPGGAEDDKGDFIMWGSLDYMSIRIIDSLSEFNIVNQKNKANVKKIESTAQIEERHLYLYKDSTAWMNYNETFDWIFHQFSEYPLIVVCLALANDFELIKSKVEGISQSSPLIFDIFKSLGHSTGVIVFRSNSYEEVIGSIIELNSICNNTYSIAGIQNYPIRKTKKDGALPLYSQLVEDDEDSNHALVSVNYILQDRDKSKDQIVKVSNSILSMSKELRKKFDLSEEDFQVFHFYELGRYDIDVQIQGNLGYVLELLINPTFGLANINSGFYKDYIFESRTTWRALPKFKGRE